MPVRVHAHLPRRLAERLLDRLDGAEVVDAGSSPWMEAAERAAQDAACVAFVGPLLSWQVAETAALLNEHGIAQLAVAATYSALTRDEPGAEDGMPASLSPSGRRTLLRLVPRDTAICRALVAAEPGPHRLVSDGTAYGEQIAAQLRLAGIEEDAQAESLVYAGLAERMPAEATLAFEGAVGGQASEARLYLAQRPGDGWADEDALAFVPQVDEAAALLRAARSDSRPEVLEALWASGRFDEFGDTRERRCGVWTADGQRPRGLGIAEVPA